VDTGGQALAEGRAAYKDAKEFVFPPPPPLPPLLDTVDVKAKTNQCLFLR
jgi:hypothetical protein